MATPTEISIISSKTYVETVNTIKNATFFSTWESKTDEQVDTYNIRLSREGFPSRITGYKWMGMSAVNYGAKLLAKRMGASTHLNDMNRAHIFESKKTEKLKYSVSIVISNRSPLTVDFSWTANTVKNVFHKSIYDRITIYDLDHYLIDSLVIKLRKRLTG